MALSPWQISTCTLCNLLPVYVARKKHALLEAGFLLLSASAMLYGQLSHGTDIAVATADGGRSVSVVVVGLYLLGRNQWKHGALIAVLLSGFSVGLAYASYAYSDYVVSEDEDDDDPIEMTYAHQFRILFTTGATVSTIFFACLVRLPSFANRMSSDMIMVHERIACFVIFLALVASEVSPTLTASFMSPGLSSVVSHAIFGLAASAAFYARPIEYAQVLQIELEN